MQYRSCFAIEEELGLMRFQYPDIKLIPEDNRVVKGSLSEQQIWYMKKLVYYRNSKEDACSFSELFTLLLSLYKTLCGKTIIKTGDIVTRDKKRMRVKRFNEEFYESSGSCFQERSESKYD